jgi:hypothetical protein
MFKILWKKRSSLLIVLLSLINRGGGEMEFKIQNSKLTFCILNVTTQPVWWRAARTTTLCRRFSPRFARAETAVLSKPE